jgi:hypothetical protein
VGTTGGWIAIISVALVALLTGRGGISDNTLVLARVGSIRLNTSYGVASSLSRAISISVAGNLAGAQVGVDSISSLRITSITSTSGVGFNREDGLSATTIATI